MLTPRDIGWIVGFLEGEGSFGFAIANRQTQRGTALVAAPQVQRQPLDRLARLVGGSIHTYQRKGVTKDGSPRKLIYSWQLNGPRAVGLMMTVYAMMSPKRRAQIEKVLAIWRTRPGTGTLQRRRTHCPRGHPYNATNTIILVNKNKKGGHGKARACRECHRMWDLKRRGGYRRGPYRVRFPYLGTGQMDLPS